MNVFVGQNDAGKTAFVEAVSLRVGHVPHRSLLSSPDPGTHIDPNSDVVVTVSLSGLEIQRALAQHPAVHVAATTGREEFAISVLNAAVERGSTVQAGLRGAAGYVAHLPELPLVPQTWVYGNNVRAPTAFSATFGGSGNSGSNVGLILTEFVRTRIYFFQAERLRVGEGAMGAGTTLAQDASNLPEVLNHLQTSNPARFRRFVEHVREVFPHITAITTRPTAPSQAVIEVWDVPTETERSDLAVALSASGTGIGQVLAMLYVVVTCHDPQVIVIDEPHSFLHPGAVRKLFAILNSYDKHQYIITTHSPTAILAATPIQLAMIRREGYESKVVAINRDSTQDLADFLSEVGARLSDVFGPDRILWVEGKTEQSTFPVVLRDFYPLALAGIEILAVQHTGDLETRHAEKIVEIYQRLSTGATLLPPAIAFVLDPEDRGAAELGRLKGLAGGIVRLLPRRMFENYLIAPGAIALILNQEDSQRTADHEPAAVEQWLAQHGIEARFFPRGMRPIAYTDSSWNENVHGADILLALLSDLSDQRVRYEKVRHGMMLTRELILVKDPSIRSLADWLFQLIIL